MEIEIYYINYMATNGADEERPKGVCSIRMVVRRFGPNKHACSSSAPLSRARSVLDNDETTDA
jgi:hypothetical protein